MRLHSPSQRKEPVGGENNTLEVKERRKQTATDPTASLHECLERKDHNVLLAMRDQARLVSTAIQLLTSPESGCLHTSPSVCHKVCCSEAAEPDHLDKPQSQVGVPPPPDRHRATFHDSAALWASSANQLTGSFFLVAQISELSDLVDRPLVAALTSRLQALHAHLQAFMEQVDSLVKPPAGRKDAVEEGGCPLASNGSPLPCSGDSQDEVDSVEEKVNTLFSLYTLYY